MHGKDQYAYAYTLFVGESERKRPLERPSRRWDDNVKIDYEELG
jgi:hypothetical protein